MTCNDMNFDNFHFNNFMSNQYDSALVLFNNA